MKKTAIKNILKYNIFILCLITSSFAFSQQIGVIGNGNSITDNSGNSPAITNFTDFGATTSRVFSIDNTQGGAPTTLSISSITLSNTTDFSISTPLVNTTITKNQTPEPFTISLIAVVAGTYTSTVTIASNASNDGGDNVWIYTISATFVAPLPEINIIGNATTINDNDPSPSLTDGTNFGNVDITSGFQPNIFTIQNLGNANLILTASPTNVVISGVDAADFILTTDATSPISGPSGTSDFTITFDPTVVGVKNAIVTIINNDTTGAESTYNFNIQGTGTVVLPPPDYTIYYENFDADAGSWTASNPGANSTWTYGLNASISGGTERNHWYTSTYSNYADNSQTYATSPVIDLTGFHNLRFLIDIRYLTESGNDGMNIEYFDGISWNVLGAYAATPENYWYNDTDVDGIANGVDGWSGDNPAPNTASGQSAFSDFITASIDLPITLDNNANVQIRVQFASNGSTTDDGANFDNVIIQGDYIVPLSDPTYAPGAVTSNLKLWLKANRGTSTSTDGDPLTTWSDEAFDNDAIGVTTSRPTFNNSAAENINFNPTVNFVNSSEHLMNGKGGYFSQDYFMVLEPNTAFDAPTTYGQQPIAGKFATENFTNDGTGLGFGLISARYTDAVVAHTISSFPNGGTAGPNSTSYGRAFEDASATLGGVMLVNVKTNAADSSTEIYINGEQIDNDTGQSGNGSDLNFNEFDNLTYYLGTGRFTANDHSINGGFDGKISELLSYSVKNSVADKQKVQSSLAIKYGITLHEGTQTTETDVDYVDSDGTVIWDESANAGFNFDIAGIGRDDAAELDQRQSKTVNTTADITMGLTDIEATNTANTNSFANDKNFLVWGNDNLTLAVQPAIPVDMSLGISGLNTIVDFRPSGRTWKVVENGTIGTTKISAPYTSILLPLGVPPGDYLMFISPTPTFAPTAEYRVMTTNDGGINYETDYNFNGTNYITFGFAPEYTFVRSIEFDGTTDYLDSGDVLDLNTTIANPTGSFTMSAWINKDANEGSIVSKRDSGFTTGYDFNINSSGDLVFAWIDSGIESITSSITIPSDVWHHVAVVFDGTNAKLYIDGIEDTAAIATASFSALDTTEDFRIATGGSAASYFEGNIDEVRVFDIALTEDQLRYIMNQEIEEDLGNSVSGAYFNRSLTLPSALPLPVVIPVTPTKNDIGTVPWANLQAYYPMSRYTFTNTKDESNNNFTAALKQITTVDFQNAPIPYVSSGTTTDWDTNTTWINGASQRIPGSVSILDATKTIDWNIVETNHAITMDNSSLPAGNLDNRTLLALAVKSNELTIDGTATTGNGITISHYLKLDGVLDLQGESQLIQTDRSDLATSSAGSLEKDQQGTANSFTYNYWSSPVSFIGAGSNNNSFNIENVLFDGTIPDDLTRNITFGADNNPYHSDGAVTDPINITSYWLWKFVNSGNDYANWEWIGNNDTPLNVTEGFTMKGISNVSSIATEQNYVFIGKPNNVLNGDTEIVHTNFGVPANPLYPEISLTGNPFPSALDADQFLTDNLASTNGQLYFWEHWGGGTHEWQQYQGGYAIRNIITGVPSVAFSHPDVDQTGGGLKGAPGQYVAVSQGFYVISSAAGGNVVFKNSQRTFQKEGASSTFFKQSGKGNKSSEEEGENGKMIMRVGFESPDGFHRQVAVAFEIDGTTDGFDKGYDSPSGDFLSNDAFFIQDDNYYVIQAFGDFKKNREIPISIFIDADNDNGLQTFMIDKLENIPEDIEIYIKDNVSGETHDIRDQSYEVNLATGEHKTRFSLVFQPRLLRSEEISEIEDGFLIYMNNNLSEINIKKIADIDVTKAVLVNSLGQTINIWSNRLDSRYITLPVNVSTGVYILSVETEQGTINKKLLIE